VDGRDKPGHDGRIALVIEVEQTDYAVFAHFAAIPTSKNRRMS
jgi:hypothetical protein